MEMANEFDWMFSSNVRDIKEKAHAFARQHIVPLASKIDAENYFPKALWPLFGDAKILDVADYFSQMLLVEVISQYSASIGLSYGAHVNLCMNQLRRYGTDEQKSTYLPKLASGEWIGALAMSEKNAGSDVLSMQLNATANNDHFILNGHKMWITNGPDADVIVVYAKTNPGAGAHGMSAFIIEKNFKGFRAGEKLNKVGMRGSHTSPLYFEDCVVPKANLLGELNNGVSILMSGLDYERVILSAGPLGIMQACLDVVVPYVNQREQFNKPLSSFEMIQEKIANMYTQLQSARSFVYYAARACDEGKIHAALASSCYLYAAEQAVDVATNAIQCLGGMGYLNDYPLGRYLRDAKLYEIGAGTSEIRRLIIAKQM